MKISKPKPSAPMITIVGSPGVGKTTLGALFPKPLFIQAEESGTVFETWDDEVQPSLAPKLPRANKAKNVSTKIALLEQIQWLIQNEHDFETLVIDSVTSLHTLFEHEVCQDYGVDNVADAAGGYHKGYLVCAEMHSDIKNACDALRRRKNMSIIFLAHCGIQKMKNRPDADEYTVYTLDMHQASVNHYVNLVDAVLYLRNEEFVQGREVSRKGQVTRYGKAIQTGQRVLVTTGDGRMGYVNAKNRYQLESEINIAQGENPLLDLIPFYIKTKGE